ncbi:hypothetical protein H6G88_03175 [Bifidobacterium ruminantium]|uniref:hypothetical protein n=1 Tax=Bifidobacterium ruminantium TaxID=78346 RepID=UPI00195C1CFB|nr:hypothetical protein [Bifidobacterium ruminantium]MBM6746308.1 hypothetical protein [Bifidobacterium ruminantium]
MPVGYASRTDVAVGAERAPTPGKAANTLNRGSLTASLQLTMAFAACREWLHSAVFRPEMQLMQLLQLFAYKKRKGIRAIRGGTIGLHAFTEKKSQMTTLTTLTTFIV